MTGIHTAGTVIVMLLILMVAVATDFRNLRSKLKHRALAKAVTKSPMMRKIEPIKHRAEIR
jgi:hypothetical protein